MKDTFQITTEVIKGECLFKIKNGHLFDFRENPEEITSKLVHREGLDDWNIEIFQDHADSSKVFYFVVGLTRNKSSIAKEFECQKDHPDNVAVSLLCEVPIGSKCVRNNDKCLLLTDTILITDPEIDQYIQLK